MYIYICIFYLNFQGVELLPDYSKVNFPEMAVLDLRTLLLPGAHPEDVSFVQTMLRLCPAERFSAWDALTSTGYFSQPPLPCPVSSSSLFMTDYRNHSSCNRSSNLLLEHHAKEMKLPGKEIEKAIKSTEEFQRVAVEPVFAKLKS